MQLFARIGDVGYTLTILTIAKAKDNVNRNIV